MKDLRSNSCFCAKGEFRTLGHTEPSTFEAETFQDYCFTVKKAASWTKVEDIRDGPANELEKKALLYELIARLRFAKLPKL